MSRKAGVVLTIFITGLLLTVAASAGASLLPFSATRVMPNVQAATLDLGGMSREQGILKLLEFEDELKEKKITLKARDIARELPLKSVDVDIDEQTVMDKALQVGHTGPIWQRWNERMRSHSEKIRIPLAVSMDREKLKSKVNELLTDIINSPVDAGFRVTQDDKIEIIPGQKGHQVDHESLYNKLLMLIAHGVGPYEAEVALVETEPAHTVENIQSMGIKGLLSSYTTKFDPGQVGRTYNVRVAAAALDGLLVSPGEEVSFNKVVGPRSTEAGYKNAKIILNNEFVEGLGGGVCQVSSTLYNAILLADLEVTERDNHSLPVGYVPIGRDATVAYKYLDFRFKNNQDSYLLLKSKAGQNSLTFKIYGNTDNKKDVTISSWVIRVLEPETVYEEDPNLAEGEEIVKQEGVQGYEAAGEMVIKHNGGETRKPLPDSLYRPLNEIIAVGTKETETSIKLPGGETPEGETGHDNEVPGSEEENSAEKEVPSEKQGQDNSGENHAGAGTGEDEAGRENQDDNAAEDVTGEISGGEEQTPETGQEKGEQQGDEEPQQSTGESKGEEGSTRDDPHPESHGDGITGDITGETPPLQDNE